MPLLFPDNKNNQNQYRISVAWPEPSRVGVAIGSQTIGKQETLSVSVNSVVQLTTAGLTKPTVEQ